jgi:hypothetical protein
MIKERESLSETLWIKTGATMKAKISVRNVVMRRR